MTIWKIDLGWNTLSIAQAMQKKLSELKFLDWKSEKPLKKEGMTFGMNDKSESAFCIAAKKNDFAFRIYVENEAQQIKISAGSLNKGKPEFDEIFNSKQQKQASDFFETCIKAYKEQDNNSLESGN